MRKIILAVATLAFITFSSSCNGIVKSADGANDSIGDSTETEALAFDSVEVSDSIILSKTDRVEATVKCLYPVTGEQCLKDSIIWWINNKVLVDNNGNPFANASADIKNNVRNVVMSFMKSDSIEAAEMIRTNRSAEIDMPVEYDHDMEIEVAYEDDDYVTMSYNIFTYMAGAAHGSTLAACVTFSKKDGHRVGWELTSAYSKDELTRIVKDGLKEYFGAKSEEELREYLLDVDEKTYNTAFPMPQTPPYILKNGIHLTYQQYEIAPYAAGMPDVMIPIK